MAELTYREAVVHGLAQEMRRDPLVVAIGEDIAAAGGVESLANRGIDAEVIDVRTHVPLDVRTILDAVRRTSVVFTVEENPRLCGWGAEIMSIIGEEAFWDLARPPVRITTPHIPLASAATLEDVQLPSVERIVETVVHALEQ